MRYSVMINAVKRQCISHVVSGAAPAEELPPSVMEAEVEERAATGPPIIPHHNKQHLGGAQLKRLTEDICTSEKFVKSVHT